MHSISRETYELMDVDSKLNVLFDYVSQQYEMCQMCKEKIDRQAKVNTGVSALMGFVGGLVGFFMRPLLK